jgi:hypothetical protein
MLSFLLKFTLVSNSALKLLVSKFLLGISETLHCSISAPHVKIAPLDVFGARNILLNHFL